MVRSFRLWLLYIAFLVAKASRCAHAILKSFHYADFQLLARAYTIYIRPILEAASSVWSPHLKQDKVLVESVQRMYSRRLFLKCGLQQTSYEDRLKILNWCSLEHRRNHADLMLMYHILKGYVKGASALYNVHEHAYNLRGNAT